MLIYSLKRNAGGTPAMTKTKSFSCPIASCFQSGPFPLPHWELLCSGLPSTSPGPSKVMPSYSLPSHPHPAAAGRCRRVRTCVRGLGGCSALSPHSHLPLGSPPSSNATHPPRHIFQGPTHFSSTPPAPPRHCVFHRFCCFSRFSVASAGCVCGESCLGLFRVGLCLSYCLVSLARSKVPGTW